MTPVERLGRAELDGVVAALCEAFLRYPAMRFILAAPASAEYQTLDPLMRFFVLARLLRGEPVLGIRAGSAAAPQRAVGGWAPTRGTADVVGDARGGGAGTLAAVALVSEPDRPGGPAELASLREALWARLGPEARERYELYGRAAQSLIGDLPRLHLNLLGVRAAYRGRGLARLLVEQVLVVARQRGRGVSLTTEDPGNLALYARLGFELLGDAAIAPGLRTWALYRAAGSPGSGGWREP
jgi:GNAT superfamily N-acetyltransferase